MYRHTCAFPLPPKTSDTVRGPATIVQFHVSEMNWCASRLFLKRFGRFKILGDQTITDLGLNTDNPTIYGRFRKRGDTVFLKYRKSIQHFNKLAPKRRVKVKMHTKYQYFIREDGKLETDEFCFWYPTEH